MSPMPLRPHYFVQNLSSTGAHRAEESRYRPERCSRQASATWVATASVTTATVQSWYSTLTTMKLSAGKFAVQEALRRRERAAIALAFAVARCSRLSAFK